MTATWKDEVAYAFAPLCGQRAQVETERAGVQRRIEQLPRSAQEPRLAAAMKARLRPLEERLEAVEASRALVDRVVDALRAEAVAKGYPEAEPDPRLEQFGARAR